LLIEFFSVFRVILVMAFVAPPHFALFCHKTLSHSATLGFFRTTGFLSPAPVRAALDSLS
jgi:hypothetical protein